MQDMNNKVTSKGPLKSNGLDFGPCCQNFETLSHDAVTLRSKIVVETTAGQRSEDVKGLRDAGMKMT